MITKERLPKNKVLTFASLYTVEKEHTDKGKQIVVKVDKYILQRLITAYKAGREVHLKNILQHELMPVSVALATTNGKLLPTNKSVIADILTTDITTPAAVLPIGSSGLVIDGQALVIALGKPADVTTFGEYSDMFDKCVLQMGSQLTELTSHLTNM